MSHNFLVMLRDFDASFVYCSAVVHLVLKLSGSIGTSSPLSDMSSSIPVLLDLLSLCPRPHPRLRRWHYDSDTQSRAG